MKKIVLIFVMLLVAASAFGQTNQTSYRWDLYSGAWDLFVVRDYTETEDSVWVQDDTTVITESFKCWPNMSVTILVGDTTSATDSINYTINFRQDGGGFTADTSRMTRVKTLQWKSRTSSTLSSTITAAGYYSADITSSAIHSFRFGDFQIVNGTDSKKLPGNFIKFIVNGWNQRTN